MRIPQWLKSCLSCLGFGRKNPAPKKQSNNPLPPRAASPKQTTVAATTTSSSGSSTQLPTPPRKISSSTAVVTAVIPQPLTPAEKEAADKEYVQGIQAGISEKSDAIDKLINKNYATNDNSLKRTWNAMRYDTRNGNIPDENLLACRCNEMKEQTDDKKEIVDLNKIARLHAEICELAKDIKYQNAKVAEKEYIQGIQARINEKCEAIDNLINHYYPDNNHLKRSWIGMSSDIRNGNILDNKSLEYPCEMMKKQTQDPTLRAVLDNIAKLHAEIRELAEDKKFKKARYDKAVETDKTMQSLGSHQQEEELNSSDRALISVIQRDHADPSSNPVTMSRLN